MDAGFLLQVDDPSLTDILGDSRLDPRRASERADFSSRRPTGRCTAFPPDRVRYHTCYGINEGPRVHDVPWPR